MPSPRTPNDSDRQLGLELRRMRALAKLTQADAAARLGVSMQQYGKYERGENRISAARFDEMRRTFREQAGPPGMSEESVAYDAGGEVTLNEIRSDLESIRSDFDRVLRKLRS